MEAGGGGDMGSHDEDRPEKLPLKQPERLRPKRGKKRKEKSEESDNVGQDNHISVDQADSAARKPPAKKLMKSGRGRPSKIKPDLDVGEGENSGNNDEILLIQSLPELPPRMAMEELARKRGKSKVIEGDDGAITTVKGVEGVLQQQHNLLMALQEGRPLTRGLKARLDQCSSKSVALLKYPDPNMKITRAEIHDHHLTTQGISSPKLAFVSETGCLNRNMKTYLDRCLARGAPPFRSAARNVARGAPPFRSVVEKHENPNTTMPAAESFSSHVKNQGLTFSPASSTSPNETNYLNLAADLLAETHGSGDACAADPSDLEFGVDNYQPAEEAPPMPSNVIKNANKETACMSRQSGACPDRSASLNLTRMLSLVADDIADFDEVDSRADQGLVSVNEYQVKSELAPTLRDIFERYGEIAKDCFFLAARTRSCFMENVCAIYKKLEGAKLVNITSSELNLLLEQVSDLEKAEINVGWLRDRLTEVLEAKNDCKSLKEEKQRIKLATEKRKQVLICYKKEFEDCKKLLGTLAEKIHEEENALAEEEAEEDKLFEKFINLKPTLKGFYKKSLVHGLLDSPIS